MISNTAAAVQSSLVKSHAVLIDASEDTLTSLNSMQQAVLSDVRIQKQAMDVLNSYHPFWLQQAMEIVVRKRVPPSSGSVKRQKAATSSFAAQHFLNDTDLAYEWASNKAIDGLYPPQYWVSEVALEGYIWSTCAACASALE